MGNRIEALARVSIVVLVVLVLMVVGIVSITLVSCTNELTIFMVSFDSQGGSFVAAIEEANGIKIGEPPSPTRSGYVFSGWYKDSECVSEWKFGSDVVFSDMTLYAKWTADSYSVTYDSNGATNGTVPAVQAKIHEVDLILATNIGGLSRTGYSFDGWNTQPDGSGTDYAAGTSYTVNAAVTLYAKWTADSYSVTYNANGATGGTSPAVQAKIHEVDLILATNTGDLVRTGYSFDGWNNQSDGSGADYAAGTAYMGNSAVLLYAKWIANNYMVSFDVQGGSTLDPASKTVVYCQEYGLLPTSGRLGYAFSGWWTGPNGTGSRVLADTIMAITSNQTLYAKWISTHTVAFNAQGGPIVSSIEGVEYGTIINAPNSPTRVGYVFGGWYREPSCVEEWNFSTDTVTSNLTLYALWVDGYTVTFDSQGGSSVSPIEKVIQGRKVSEPVAPTRSGYTFDGWYKESSCQNLWDFNAFTVETNMTLNAKWVTSYYTVNFNSQEGTSVLAIENVEHGRKISEPISPTRSGYGFGGWYKESSCINQWFFTTDPVTSHMTLYAKWSSLYLVSFDSQGGTGVIATEDVMHGTKISEPISPTRILYGFGGWYREPSCVEEWDFTNDTVTSNLTLYAKWLGPYTVSFDSQEGSIVSPKGVYHGRKVSEPVAPTRSGYAFDGWYKESSCQNLWDFTTDTVTSNLTLYAKWISLYLVSFDSQGGSGIHAIEMGYGRKLSDPGPPTKEGNIFGGWYREKACINEWVFSTDTVASNLTLYAKWQVAYTVSFDSQGGSSVDTIEDVAYGSRITEPAIPTRNEYGFEKWYKESSCQNLWDFTTDTVTSNLTLYAKWISLYLVSFDSQGGSGIHAIEMGYGRKLSDPGPPTKEGNIFGGWYREKACINEWVFSTDTVASNLTLYAKWQVAYTVSFDSQGGSSVDTIEDVAYGSRITEPAIPTRNEYGFEKWYKESECIDEWNFGSDVVVSNTTLYAKWRESQVGGYIFYDKGSYSDGWRYLEAAPAGWSGQGAADPGYPFGYFRPEGTNIRVRTYTTRGAGKANTEALVAAMGEETYNQSSGDSKSVYAAKVCAEYTLTVGEVVYADWFLPSKDELDLMYDNLGVYGLGGFSGSTYWSSSETDADSAWKQYFSSGSQYDYSKNLGGRVRPVRAF